MLQKYKREISILKKWGIYPKSELMEFNQQGLSKPFLNSLMKKLENKQRNFLQLLSNKSEWRIHTIDPL